MAPVTLTLLSPITLAVGVKVAAPTIAQVTHVSTAASGFAPADSPSALSRNAAFR